MDQYFNVTLVEKVNERNYTFILPVGAPWAEAVAVAKFFSESIEKLAQDAERQAAERAAAKEPVETTATDVQEA